VAKEGQLQGLLSAGAKAKSVTTVPAIASAEAGQLTFIVSVMLRRLLNLLSWSS